ncbi:hypothetical protein K491DRAFT_591075 [Lophiostoma macrostomum CBS 122681]|uniref:BHLH domain-containing protein n=1 Tax=Lophiostoma macrostomum CBS 122681 TaxID=1314788 RepID=A0A6A6TH67_9PLEO|nr:hypothetical protein K491DRAFT_591075 [Lophiostoma macrostomum CBS 122681]
MVANTDYSPSTETFPYPDTFDRSYLADGYTSQPDYSLDSFFDQPVSSIEQQPLASFNFSPKSQPLVQPVTESTTPFYPAAPFTGKESYPSNLSIPNPMTVQPAPSDRRLSSPTPSLCGDAASLSPRIVKRESCDESEESTPKRPQRKRGRPRLNRLDSNTSSYSAASALQCQSAARAPHRLPHNQVERKYREGLNAELERLRRAVPTLPQCDDSGAGGDVMGQPKPSKAMILAGAIEYIRRVEDERDDAIAECQALRKKLAGVGNGEQWEWDGQV